MRRSKMATVPPSTSPRLTPQHPDLASHVGWSGLRLTVMFAVLAAGAFAASPEHHRASVLKLVTKIQRADYEGNRAALQHLYTALEPFTTDERLASRVRYWRGFALWRRAVNGFNEPADVKDLEHDATQAIAEFKESAAKDPAFVDAQVGTISCISILISLAQGNATRVQELIAQSSPLVKQTKAADPENPRFLWVLGPILWYVPADRGGGQDKAIETYQKGLEGARKSRDTQSDPLNPSWGEPELLMSLAWSSLNRTTPDVNAAEQYARSALALVPYWHYVRDILIPQIRDASVKHN